MASGTNKRKLPRWLKMTAVATIAFVGGLGGIYLGTVVFRGGSVSVQANATLDNLTISDNSEFVYLQVGDLFPLEDVTDSSGHLLNMSDLLSGQPAVVLFVSLDCEPCFKLLEFWQKGIKDRLNANVRVFVVLNAPQRPIPIEYEGLLAGMHHISIDLEHWQEMYSIGEWPTVISVDASGFVHQIQVGYIGFLEHSLFNDFVKPLK